MNIKKKVLVFYPPSKLYQRGEDRSQGNVEDSSATTMRAPNDLGYASATLRDKNYEVKLKDYQSENLKFSVYIGIPSGKPKTEQTLLP